MTPPKCDCESEMDHHTELDEHYCVGSFKIHRICARLVRRSLWFIFPIPNCHTQGRAQNND